MSQNNVQLNIGNKEIDISKLVVTGVDTDFINEIREKSAQELNNLVNREISQTVVNEINNTDFYEVGEKTVIIEGLSILRNQFINCLNQEAAMSNNNITGIELEEPTERNDLPTLLNMLKTTSDKTRVINTFCFENFILEIFDKSFNNKLKTTEMKALCSKIIENEIPFVFLYDEDLVLYQIPNYPEDDKDKTDLCYQNLIYKAIAENLKSFFSYTVNVTDEVTGITKKEKRVYNKLYIISCKSYVPKSKVLKERIEIQRGFFEWIWPTNKWLEENERISSVTYSIIKNRIKDILKYKLSSN